MRQVEQADDQPYEYFFVGIYPQKPYFDHLFKKQLKFENHKAT